MKHLGIDGAVENLLRSLPRKGLSIAGVIVIGWFLRKLYRWDWRDENYVIRAYKSHYADPANSYKYYGSYGKS